MAKVTKVLDIEIPENVPLGIYANNMGISQSKEEFILDFVLAAPPRARLVARVVVAPGHMKRIVKVLDQAMRTYEHNYGAVAMEELTETQFKYAGQ